MGLTRSDAETAAWALAPSGRLSGGAAAILTALDQLVPGGVPLFSAPLRLDIARAAADATYGWVARNRGRLPGTALCAVQSPQPIDGRAAAEIARRRQLAAPAAP